MRCTHLLAVVALASLLPSQAPSPADPAVHPDKKRVVEEVTRKRDDMRGGKIDRLNVRVKVKLKNGAKLSGVVKNGRLVEREAGLDFVEADRSSPDAGIRLYYFDETTSFVFLRWADIDTHKVVVRLSDDEVRAIEQELAERERKRLDERQAAAQAAVDGKASALLPKPGDSAAGDNPAKKDAGKDANKDAATPLLTEFPPAEGWGEAKVQEIQRRKIAVGAYPNEKEKRFLEVFTEWKKQAAQAPKPATPPGGAAGGSTAPQAAPAPGTSPK